MKKNYMLYITYKLTKKIYTIMTYSVKTGYTVPDHKIFNLLFKQVTYRKNVYIYNDSVNNYDKLMEDMYENEEYEKVFEDLRENTELFEENKYNCTNDDVFVFHDDIIGIINKYSDNQETYNILSLHYRYNTNIKIIENTYDYDRITIICLSEVGEEVGEDKHYVYIDDQTIIDIMEWKKKLVDNGRLSSKTRFGSYKGLKN